MIFLICSNHSYYDLHDFSYIAESFFSKWIQITDEDFRSNIQADYVLCRVGIAVLENLNKTLTTENKTLITENKTLITENKTLKKYNETLIDLNELSKYKSFTYI